MNFILILALSFCVPASGPVLPKDTSQLVIGIAPAWNAKTAIIYRFERRRNGRWKQLGETWSSNIGRKGLAAGRGLLDWCGPDSERKLENDKKAPAGAFYIGETYGFGDGLTNAPPGKMTPLTPTMSCISDPNSQWYNRIVDTETVESDWNWTRPLWRKDKVKSRTIVIGLNGATDPDQNNPMPGEGSCVLFHVERAGRPSVGCTTLPATHLDELVAWLSPKFKPVYMLMTREQYDELASPKLSGLPELP